MTNINKGLLLLTVAASMGFASCSDESPWSGSDTEGGISLDFSADARVMRKTRADDSVSPVVPSGELFAVNLAKSDGSYSKDWSSVEAFNREASFPIGDYTITAYYGDIDREGFNNPYYKGQTDVHVSPGAETQAQIVATLANAMVSIRYTDEFREYFSAYSASVQTEGHQWVVFAQDETRPAYIAPSEVKLDLKLTNSEGKDVTIQPASFTAVARHHYVVTLGLQNSGGDVALDVQFDDDVVAETVNVSLGDELFSAPAPSVTAKGFDPQTPVEAFEYAAASLKPEFHVFSYGGLKSATLNVISENGYAPAFGRSVELVNADALTQQRLASEGVDCAGFFRNVDKMGVVDLSKFIEHLPAGTYTVQLQVVDAMTRTSEPLSMQVKINSVEFAFGDPLPLEFMASEVSVDINTNCPDIKNKLTFQVPDANNRMVNAQIKSVTEVTGTQGVKTRAAGLHTFRYVLALPIQGSSAIDVTATLGNRTIEQQVAVTAPEYTITPDAFANMVVLKIEGESDAATKTIFENVRFYNNGTEIPSSNITHVASSNYVTISGLTPGVTYVALKAKVGAFEKAVPQFTTELETGVTNGNFSAATETINFQNVEVGGQYQVVIKYQLKANIVRSTPDNWATVNDLTCWGGSSTKNTWFLVPSTYVDGGVAVIRSVGYHHNGTKPATSSHATRYYCQNAPSELQRAAGELFLGSYSFDGSEHRTDGIAWASRPATLSFDYSYAPVGDEQAEAYIKVYGESGDVISQQTVYFGSAPQTTSKTVALPAYAFGKKPAKIALGFKSTKSGVTPSINIPSGSALNEGSGLGNKHIGTNTYHAVATGSKLIVDNVRLGYDFSSASRAPRRAKAAKRR